jgi:hypothetical protein
MLQSTCRNSERLAGIPPSIVRNHSLLTNGKKAVNWPTRRFPVTAFTQAVGSAPLQ